MLGGDGGPVLPNTKLLIAVTLHCGKYLYLLLQLELDQCHSLEAIFPLWDTAVTFSLDSLLDRLLEIVAARLQSWILNNRDVQWLNRLGWEEMHQVE